MEKIDILFIGFIIFVIITNCYIIYLKTSVKFLCEILAKHRVAIDELLNAIQHQVNINDTQSEINKIISDKLKINYIINLDDSSTGGQKQSN